MSDYDVANKPAKAKQANAEQAYGFEAIKAWAREGYADASSLLGGMYEYGDGVEQDYDEAENWYKLAVEQGITSAQDSLDDMKRNRRGVAHKQADGFEAHEQADGFEAIKAWAREGYVDASFLLGTMYHYGDGVKQDYDQAVNWYEKAVAQGHASAQDSLDDMKRDRRGVAHE
jgi:TPR repeat protein